MAELMRKIDGDVGALRENASQALADEKAEIRAKLGARSTVERVVLGWGVGTRAVVLKGEYTCTRLGGRNASGGTDGRGCWYQARGHESEHRGAAAEHHCASWYKSTQICWHVYTAYRCSACCYAICGTDVAYGAT
eukprot:2447884-Rhodomonas_salina.1